MALGPSFLHHVITPVGPALFVQGAPTESLVRVGDWLAEAPPIMSGNVIITYRGKDGRHLSLGTPDGRR